MERLSWLADAEVLLKVLLMCLQCKIWSLFFVQASAVEAAEAMRTLKSETCRQRQTFPALRF